MSNSKSIAVRTLPAAAAAALVLALLTTAIASAGTQTLALAAGELPGSGGASERLAILSVDEATGAESILARLVARTDGGGRQAGDRIGDDLVIDGDAIWGTKGTGIDVDISSHLKPGHLFVLLDTLELVEIRGIWGPDGAASPDPEDVLIHGPLWDVEACGRPTAMAEGLRRVADPDVAFAQPFLAIGTTGGCVGLASVDLASFEEPIFAFEEPIFAFEEPIFALDAPLIAVTAPGGGEAPPVDDVVIHPTRAEWGVVGPSFVPGIDQWIPPAESWSPPEEDWVPTIDDWIPGIDEWYEIAAASGDRLFGVYPGVLPVAEHLGVPPYATYIVEHGIRPLFSGVVTERQAPDAAMRIEIPEGLAAAPLAAANGTQSVLLTAVGPGTMWGTTTELTVLGETPLAVPPFDTLAAGSLWVAADDGRGLAFLPQYDHASGAPGPVRVLDDLFEAQITPRAINRRSNGNFVTAVISGDEEAVLAVQPFSARLSVESVEEAALSPLAATLEDDDGEFVLVVKFDRQALHDLFAGFQRNDEPTLHLDWTYGDQCGGGPCAGGYAQTVRVVK